MTRSNSHNRGHAQEFLIAGCSILVLVLFFYCGLFAVPSADDYAYTNLVMGHDFWRAQLDLYLGWSSRYTATLLITWFGKFYLQQYWLVPWLSLSLILFSFLFLYWTVFFQFRQEKHFFLFALSFFALYLSSSIAGHGVGVINEGFFYLSGAVTYQIGAVFYFLFIGCFLWMARDRYRVLNLFFSSSFLVLAIGSNETLMALSLGTVLVLIWLYRMHFQINFLVIFAIALTCFLVVLFAPGNSVRLSTTEGRDIFSALGICVEKLVETYFYSLINPMLWLFVIFFQSILDKFVASVQHLLPLRYFYFCLALLVYSLYFPIAWSLDSGAPDRLVSFIGFLGLFCSIFFVRALLQQATRFVSLKKIIKVSFIVVVLFFPFMFESLSVAVITAFTGPGFHKSHMERDAYVQRMAEAGTSSVGVRAIKRNRLLTVKDLDTPDRSVFYAKYHGVQEIFVTE